MKDPNSSASAASLFTEAKEYVDTRLEYARLAVIDKTADWGGGLIVLAICALIATGLILILSYAVASVLSAKMDSRPAGFFIVGGFYLFVLLILYVFRIRLVRSRLTNALIRKAFQ